MSESLEFYLRHKDTYLPIASFCSSSAYMEAFDYEVPSYSGLTPVTKELVGYVQAKAEKTIKETKKTIANWEKEKEQILQAANSLEEKMEYINGNAEWIEECEETIESWTSVLYFTYFLRDILEEGPYASHYEKNGKRCNWMPDAIEVHDADPDKYLYVGIEPQSCKDINEITEEDKESWI